MSRLRYNNSVGTLGGSLTSTGTTITFGSAPSWSTIVSPDYIPLVLEPPGASPSANFEVVYVTAYTAGATTATIVRAQEGTTAVSHSNGVAWMVAPTTNDFPTGITYTPAAAPPPSRALRSAAQTVSASTWTKLLLDTTSFDPNGYMDVATNHRYNVPAAGYYQVNAQTFVSSGFVLAGIYKNGVVYVYGENAPGSTAGNMTSNVSDVIQCNAGDYLELWIFAQNGSIPSGNENFLSVVPLTQQSIASQITPVAARAYRTASYSSTGVGAAVKVPLDTLSFDTGSNMDVATNHRFNVPVAGYYQVNGAFCVTGATDLVGVFIYQNGASVAEGNIGQAGSDSEFAAVVSDVLKCAAGDYIELWGYTSHSGETVQPGVDTYLSVSQVSGVPGANLAAARAYRNAALTITASTWTKIPVDTVSFDLNGNMDVATNHRYNVPAAGPYLVTGVSDTETNPCYVAIYKNGNVVAYGGGVNGRSSVTDIVQCNAGDYIELYMNAATTVLNVSNGSAVNFLSVTPLVSAVASTPGFGSSGSSSAATNVARGYRNAALTLTAVTPTKIPLDTVSFDPVGMVDIANGRVKIPQAGWYQVEGCCVGAASGNNYISIYKNGVDVADAGWPGTNSPQMVISDVIQCNAGDYLELWTNQNSTSLGGVGSSRNNYFSVAQVQAPGGTGNANALPAGASYQNGVINSTDLAISAISINTSTGVLTFTLASAVPVIIKDASGLLVPVTRSGVTTTLAPSSLPASTFSEVLGVEMDTNGLLYLAVGAQVSGQLSTGSAIATNSPSVTPGRIRLADVGVYNNAGVYNFCNNSTTPAQGTNWIDRRPWARGFNNSAQGSQSGTDYGTTSASLVAVDSTTLSFRAECSGAPIKFTATLSAYLSTSGDGIYVALMMDGTLVNGTQQQENTGSASMPITIAADFTPAAGSHLFQLGYAAQVAGNRVNILNRAASNLLGFPVMSVREMIVQLASNGSV